MIHIKEINIAKVLVNKRKEKGITQGELAKYIGVSKASVSKWETEQRFYLPHVLEGKTYQIQNHD